MSKTIGKNELRAFRKGCNGERPLISAAQIAEFERLYRESYSTVYGRVLFRMRDEEAARDVTAEAFLRAARFYDRFDPSRAKFATWVNAIARNCIVDYYRKNKEHIPIDDVPESAFATNDDPMRSTADADLAQRLLERLDEVDRDIVFMKFCEERTSAEIAEILDMNPSTVATRVHRALAKLRADTIKHSA